MDGDSVTPEEREAISRQHPMWPVFEAYYANRRHRRWPWLVVLAAALLLTAGITLRA